jgi:2-polyprenyl-6-methoxyphenol hydroxylase-like FAD-dependent oxidoreductase
MTDSTGQRHHYTLPAGKMSPQVWASQKARARSVLPPQFSELVQKTKTPFIQEITDVFSEQNVFMDGKVLLVGDALAGFRPHTAASTAQAAMHALLLDKVIRREMELREWQRQTLEYADMMSQRGIEMGNRSQFSGAEA